MFDFKWIKYSTEIIHSNYKFLQKILSAFEFTDRCEIFVCDIFGENWAAAWKILSDRQLPEDPYLG